MQVNSFPSHHGNPSGNSTARLYMLPARNRKERTNHGFRQNLSMETFNIFTNESVNPQRMATRAAIKAFGNSAPIEDTEIEIDEGELDGNGIWTPPERR